MIEQLKELVEEADVGGYGRRRTEPADGPTSIDLLPVTTLDPAQGDPAAIEVQFDDEVDIPDAEMLAHVRHRRREQANAARKTYLDGRLRRARAHMHAAAVAARTHAARRLSSLAEDLILAKSNERQGGGQVIDVRASTLAMRILQRELPGDVAGCMAVEAGQYPAFSEPWPSLIDQHGNVLAERRPEPVAEGDRLRVLAE